MEVTFLGLEVTIPDDPVAFIKAKAIELLNHLGYEWPTSNEDMLDQWAELWGELLSRGLGITWRDTQPPKKGRWKRDLQRHLPRLFGRGCPYKTPQPEGAPRPGKPVLHDLCGWGDGDLNQWEEADLVAVEILHQLRGDHAAVLLLFEMWVRGTDIQDALDVVAAATAAGA